MGGYISKDYEDKGYSAIQFVAGSVCTDAEFNLMQNLFDIRSREAIRTIVGESGYSVKEPYSFKVSDDEKTLGEGHMFVDGILISNPESVAIENDLTGLVYLEVKQILVTPRDDPSIADPALERMLTSNRFKYVWKVKCDSGFGTNDTSNVAVDTWKNKMDSESGAKLSYWFSEKCRIPENRLYRVEVHKVEKDSIQLKWSRYNASREFSVVHRGNLKYEVTTKMPYTKELKTGVIVELINCDESNTRNSGELFEITSVEYEPQLAVTLKSLDSDKDTSMPDKGKMVIWFEGLPANKYSSILVKVDNGDTVIDGDINIDSPDWSKASPGDYWHITARVGHFVPNEKNDAKTKDSHPKKHYCPIAVIDDGNVVDVRKSFTPLSKRSDFRISQIQYSVSNLQRTNLGNDSNIPIQKNNDGVWIMPSQRSAQQSFPMYQDISFKIFITTTKPVNMDSVVRTRDKISYVKPSILLTSVIEVIEEEHTSTEIIHQIKANVDDSEDSCTLAINANQVFGELYKRCGSNLNNSQKIFLMQLKINGNHILDKSGNHLDCDSFSSLVGNRNEMIYPTGDGAPGGLFAMWFWVRIMDKQEPLPSLDAVNVYSESNKSNSINRLEPGRNYSVVVTLNDNTPEDVQITIGHNSRNASFFEMNGTDDEIIETIHEGSNSCSVNLYIGSRTQFADEEFKITASSDQVDNQVEAELTIVAPEKPQLSAVTLDLPSASNGIVDTNKPYEMIISAFDQHDKPFTPDANANIELTSAHTDANVGNVLFGSSENSINSETLKCTFDRNVNTTTCYFKVNQSSLVSGEFEITLSVDGVDKVTKKLSIKHHIPHDVEIKLVGRPCIRVGESNRKFVLCLKNEDGSDFVPNENIECHIETQESSDLKISGKKKLNPIFGESQSFIEKPLKISNDIFDEHGEKVNIKFTIAGKTFEKQIQVCPKFNINGAISMKQGSKKIEDEKGNAIELDGELVVRSGRTLVPVRSFVEYILGGTVLYEEVTKKITCNVDNESLEMIIGKGIARIDGRIYTLDEPPGIINDIAYVQLRPLCDVFGAEIEYKPDTQEIIFNRGKKIG